MQTELKVRPSGLERAHLCPGSVGAEAPMPYVESEAANRGKKLHDAMALLFQAGEKAWESIAANPAISQAEVAILEDCYKLGRSQEPEDPNTKTVVEHQLDMSFLGLVGGKPDLFYVSPKFQTAVLIDWKFGVGTVEDPATNWQMRAYGLGVIKSSKSNLVAVEPIIIQPSAFKKDDRVRAHVWKKEELEGFGEDIKGIVAKAKDPKAPRIAGDVQCHFCKAKESCAEYLAYAGQRKEIKEQAQATALLTIQSGSKVEVVPDSPLVAPVVILDEETIKLAEDKKALMLSMKVTDIDTANAVGKLSKDIRGLINLIEKNREKVKAPFLNFGRKIDAEAKKATVPLNEAAEFGDSLVNTWRQQEAAKALAIQQAEAKKQAEAEAERQKALEAEREAAQKAQLAALEAQLALERAANLKSKAAQDKARAEAEVAQKKVKELQAEAERQQQIQLDAERKEREANAAAVIAAQPQAKVAGYRDTIKPTWQIPDMAKIPPAMLGLVLLPNEKVIDQMVKTGAITEANAPWIVINRTPTMARSR